MANQIFEKVFIEKNLIDHPVVQKSKKLFKQSEHVLINEYTDIFGKVHKPYLKKRNSLNLFLAKKKGQLVKEAPQAYGISKEPHYYFIHAYNCIYECQYCYLQGYFNSPDIVLFLNYEEIIYEIKSIIDRTPFFSPHQKLWFHAGEFSDSLALSHISDELSHLFDFFKKHPQAFLELRTKSVNLKRLLQFKPLPNIVVTYSLSPESLSKTIDLKTPSTQLRLKAISQLVTSGFNIGLHFDPICPTLNTENTQIEYQDLFKQVISIVPDEQLSYISLGLVRFTPDVYQQVKKNYPESLIHSNEFSKSFDGKIRWPRALRRPLLNSFKDFLSQYYKAEKIYLCMED